MSDRDLGILPTEIDRDPNAEVALVFGVLADGLDQAAVRGWLATLKAQVDALESHQGRETPYASVVIGLGQRFFNRFPDLAANNPYGLTRPPRLPADASDADFFLHVTHTSEARLAAFLKALWGTRPALVSLDVERGYTRRDGREPFGQLDGLRNLTRHQRCEHTQIDLGELPEEPAWLEGGAYAAYLKIEQNLDKWNQIDPTVREQIIGRHATDGSRLDLPAGTDPKAEGAYTDPSIPAPTSHVRKAGPRGPVDDQNLVFRRGVPYLEVVNGALHVGLQFVSYQKSLDDFDVVLNRWMLNPDFPTPGAGQDALVTNGLITFLRSGVFVILPRDDRFPAAGYFEPPKPPAHHPKSGRIHVRKTAVDQSSNPVEAEIGDIEFAVFDTDGNQIGSPVRTNPAGRAVLLDIPLGATVTVRETPNPRFEAWPEVQVTLDKPAHILTAVNRLVANAHPYGG